MNSLEMEGISVTGWKNLKQRLSFKGLGGCCGASSWATTRAETLPLNVDQEEEEEEEGEEPIIQTLAQVIRSTDQSSATRVTTTNPAGMNLAMALAAERNSRAQNVIPAKSHGGPIKTLMRLIEETDGVDWMMSTKGRDSGHKEEEGVRVRGNAENDWVCCVCMERNKGAAFIPCGHAYCRICSRELLVSRESCPICNRSIVDVLDIF